MPRRAARLRDNVRGANIADAFGPFLAFVNEGRATWVRDGEEYSFDVEAPKHAEVRRAVREVLSELHRAGCAGDAAVSRGAHTRLAPLKPTRPEDVGEHASVEERDRRIEELTGALNTAALISLCEAMLDDFLAAPAIQGYRLLGCCASCGSWFLEDHGQQRYCSLPCRRRRS